MHNFVPPFLYLFLSIRVVFCEMSCAALQLSCQVLQNTLVMHDS